ncbi:MAG TPA: hypothetical protein VJO34_10630 [Methylomirabilota bacterium]|nr:hypothetical protein [Methylomirabilota bacterium]
MTVEESVELRFKRGELLFERLSRSARRLSLCSFPLVDLPKHLLGPGVGHGSCLNGPTKLSGKSFFAEVRLTARPLLLGTTIVVMPLLPLSGDGAAALTTIEQTGEGEEMLPLRLRLSSPRHHLLNPFKQLPRNQWLM